MEELYMAIIKFFSAYGWQMTVLALSGIFLLGVLKSVKHLTGLGYMQSRARKRLCTSIRLSK